MKNHITTKEKLHRFFPVPLLAVILFLNLFLIGQYALGQRYLQHSFVNETLVVDTDQGKYHFQPYTKQILKVSFLPTGVNSFVESHSVVKKAEVVSFNLDEQPKSVTLGTNFYSVTINKKPFSIALKSGGKTALTDQKVFKNDSVTGFRFNYPATEVLIGGGERAIAMDRRGHSFQLYNQPRYGYQIGETNLNYGIPYVVSSELYSVLFDNPQKGYMDFGKANPKQWEVSFIGGELTYYFIAGTSHHDVIKNYTTLTGRQPLPPRWALGNLTSRMAYQNETETRGVVEQMQAEDFPMDAIIIDLNWFGKFGSGPANMGNLDWDRDNWPTAEKMIKDFEAKKVKTVLITEPYFVDSTTHYDYLKENKLLATDKNGDSYFLTKFYFGNGGLIDIFKPEAQEWFWKQYKKHKETGIAGWWGDLGEPEHHPKDVMHVNGKADEVHNIYGHYWEKVLFEGYEKEYREERVFNLSRSGYAGSQRFSIFPWSGDVSRSWGGLQAQPPIMLAMSMSGLGYMHSDLGGFAQGEKDPELYTRWLQFGVFNPVFRPHGSGHPSEPIYWDDETKDRVRKAIKLRYRLLPYTYTLAWENNQSGAPLTRPIWYYEPANRELYKIDDTYFWGENLLVAPVLEKGVTERKVYLPKGVWFDFYTGEKHQGQQWITQKLSMENIPVFARGGSFIPMTKKPFSNTEDYSLQSLLIHFYPSGEKGKQINYTLYEDDGKRNKAYFYSDYGMLLFGAKEEETVLKLDVNKEGPNFDVMPDQHLMEFVIHDQENVPSSVQVSGTKLEMGKTAKRFEKMYYGYFHDAAKKELRVRIVYMGVNKYEVVINR